MNSVIISYILSTVLISFLEQGFISLLSLRFLGAKINSKMIMFLVVLPAILSNLPILFNWDRNFSMVIGFVCTTILVIVFLKKISFLDIILTIIYVLLSTVIFLATELSCVLAVMGILKLSRYYIVSNTFVTFLVSIPERIIQYSILYVMYFKIKSPIKINLFKGKNAKNNIVKNNSKYYILDVIAMLRVSAKTKTLILICCAIMSLYLFFFADIFIIKGYIHLFSPLQSILLSIFVFAVPVIILLLLFIIFKASCDFFAKLDDSKSAHIRRRAVSAQKCLKNGSNKEASWEIDTIIGLSSKNDVL